VFTGAAALAEGLLAGRGMESEPRLADPGFALSRSLYWALVGLTDLGPVAVVVDDVQWADALSLRFLAFAVRRSEGLPLLVALARRDGGAGELPDELSGVVGGSVSVIRPAPLSAEAIGVLLARAVGRELGEEVVSEAERLTEGNPLYVRELAGSLAAGGAGPGEDPLGVLRGAAPAAVAWRVRAALARLDGAAAGIARAAAVLGDEVPLRRAAALAEVEPGRASGAADVLVCAGILAVGEPLRFRHPLVREAVLESIEPRARARAHGLAARLLSAEGERPERAAVHLLESDPAGDPEVVATLRAAAKRASAGAAPELAVSALDRALREPPAAAQRPLVLNELAMAEAVVGREGALGRFEEAFETVGSLEEIADGAVPYVWLQIARGRLEEAEAVIDRFCGAIGDRERRLMVEAELGALGIWFPLGGERLARVANGLRGDTQAERLLLALRAADAVNHASITAPDAARLVTSALGGGRLLAELGPDSPMYLVLLAALLFTPEWDPVEKELAAALVVAERRGAGMGLAMALAYRASIAWRRGRLLSAEAEARNAVEIMTQLGWQAAFPIPMVILVGVLVSAGALDEADRLLEENGLGGPVPNAPAYIELLGVRGRLRLAQRRTEQGIEDLEQQRARLDDAGYSPPHLYTMLAQALVPALVQAGREQQARALADEAVRVARAFGAPRFIADALRGSALAQPGGPDLDQLQAAATIYEQIPASIDLALTLLDIGSAMRRRRERAAAREPLRRALDLARASGARPLAERAEHELRATGARPRRDRITGRDSLTATEHRVAHLAAEGMTNRQIAETLFVTRKTVESHLEHIFRKLEIHARGELAQALASETQPVPSPGDPTQVVSGSSAARHDNHNS
jgi:DNA-binding CsgD family transcriptional regulator